MPRFFCPPGRGGVVNIWDVRARKAAVSLETGDPLVRSLAFAPDGVTLAVGGERLSVWDLEAQACQADLGEPHRTFVGMYLPYFIFFYFFRCVRRSAQGIGFSILSVYFATKIFFLGLCLAQTRWRLRTACCTQTGGTGRFGCGLRQTRAPTTPPSPPPPATTTSGRSTTTPTRSPRRYPPRRLRCTLFQRMC